MSLCPFDAKPALYFNGENLQYKLLNYFAVCVRCFSLGSVESALLLSEIILPKNFYSYRISYTKVHHYGAWGSKPKNVKYSEFRFFWFKIRAMEGPYLLFIYVNIIFTSSLMF